MEKDQMIWNSVWDSDRNITKMYHVSSIPDNYLINENGVVVAKNVRGKKLENLLSNMLNSK